MTIELTEKFIGFVDIMGFQSLMTRADAGTGLENAEPSGRLRYSLFAGNHRPRLRFAMIGSRGFATRDNASMKMGSQALI